MLLLPDLSNSETTYCGQLSILKNPDNLQVSIFKWNCDTVIAYLENDVSLIFVHFFQKPNFMHTKLL